MGVAGLFWVVCSIGCFLPRLVDEVREVVRLVESRVARGGTGFIFLIYKLRIFERER